MRERDAFEAGETIEITKEQIDTLETVLNDYVDREKQLPSDDNELYDAILAAHILTDEQEFLLELFATAVIFETMREHLRKIS